MTAMNEDETLARVRSRGADFTVEMWRFGEELSHRIRQRI